MFIYNEVPSVLVLSIDRIVLTTYFLTCLERGLKNEDPTSLLCCNGDAFSSSLTSKRVQRKLPVLGLCVQLVTYFAVSRYSLNDLWILLRPDGRGDCETLLLRSAFYGPSGSMLEVTPLSTAVGASSSAVASLERFADATSDLVALRGPNVGSELHMLGLYDACTFFSCLAQLSVPPKSNWQLSLKIKSRCCHRFLLDALYQAPC